MSYSGSGNSSGWSQGGNQAGGPNYRHALDPYLEPELFRSVLTRRVIAFIIDLFILAVPIALAVIFIAVFGLVTLGLGWALFWLVSPASIVWALVYYGASLGGPHSATIGMRMMDLEMAMKITASAIGTARMKRSMMKAITRRVSTLRNSSGSR